MSKFPIIVIHGGADRKPSSKREVVEASLRNILDEAYAILSRGGSALDAVERAVILLENDSLFNAGKGSKIQSDGVIRMSAGLMDGKKLRFSGCVNVEDVKNPISLARKLQRFESRVLSEDGAEKFARQKNMKFSSPYTPEQITSWKKMKKQKFGTVGAVAIDRSGYLSAATSTGGRGFEFPHRVSDTPTVAGNYANSTCAISVTGVGEQIVDHAVAAVICSMVDSGVQIDRAIDYVIKSARKKKSDFGLIAVDKKGNVRAAKTSPHLTWGYQTKEKTFVEP